MPTVPHTLGSSSCSGWSCGSGFYSPCKTVTRRKHDMISTSTTYRAFAASRSITYTYMLPKRIGLPHFDRQSIWCKSTIQSGLFSRYAIAKRRCWLDPHHLKSTYMMTARGRDLLHLMKTPPPTMLTQHSHRTLRTRTNYCAVYVSLCWAFVWRRVVLLKVQDVFQSYYRIW